jgi:hypothetical protein
MYFREPAPSAGPIAPLALTDVAALFLAALAILGLGLFPSSLFHLVELVA